MTEANNKFLPLGCIGCRTSWLLALLVASNCLGAETPISKAPIEIQLIESNRQLPIADASGWVTFKVDGSILTSDSVKSNPEGLVDLAPFLQKLTTVSETYRDRVLIEVGIGEQGASLRMDQLKTPAPKVLLDLGPVLVTGYLIKRSGVRVSKFEEFFPPAIREFAVPIESFWSGQMRLFQGTKKPDRKMVSNAVRVEKDGRFQIYLQKNQTYQFEPMGFRTIRIIATDFMTGTADMELGLTAEAKPYCLYGDFIDKSTGSPVKDVDITGLDAHFYGSGSKYCLFFDSARTVDLTVGSYVFTKNYHPLKATVKISEPLQRQNFELEPLAGSPLAFKFFTRIGGIQISNAHDVSPYISGSNYFSQSGKYLGNNRYEFVIPQSGNYKLAIASTRFHVDASEQLFLDREQTLELTAVAKDTWVEVTVLDETGKPVSFPTDSEFRVRMHEQMENCVILTAMPTLNDRSKIPRNYLGAGLMDVGGSLRPDENGAVKFLLTKGGSYFLNTWFKRFKDSETPIEIRPHETNRFELRLKAL